MRELYSNETLVQGELVMSIPSATVKQSQRIFLFFRSASKQRSLTKATWVIAVAGLSMGNQSCEKAKEKRVLKMEVELGQIEAKPIRLPTGEVVDFPYVVNSLFYRQVMNNNHFVISGPVPSPNSLLMASGQLPSLAGLQSKGIATKMDAGLMARGDDEIAHDDLRVLARYGFLNQIARQAASQMRGEFSLNDVEGAGLASKSATGSLPTNSQPSTTPGCLYNMPQSQLGGQVISFETTWGVGVGVGYGVNGAIPGQISGNVDFSQSKLEMGLRSDDPLTMETLVVADGIANQSKVKFSANFTAGLPLGLNFFFNTPLADVIKKSMDRGLSEVVKKYKDMSGAEKSWDDVWESRVLYDPEIVDNDNYIAFRGGSRSNIQVGDKFKVTNLHYKWEGAACYTRLVDRIPLTPTPIAEVEVVSQGLNSSVAKVTRYLIEQRIRPGAQVKIMALKPPPPPTPAPKKNELN